MALGWIIIILAWQKHREKWSRNTYRLDTLLLGNLLGIVTFVPRTEWSGINHHDTVLDQSLGTHQLVVGSIVHNIDDTSLASAVCKEERGSSINDASTRLLKTYVPMTS